jgi:DNA polymerase III gamma/tau subunit
VSVHSVVAAKKEQQQRLRQALKVLAESEKQLRVSNDRPTWLTAALLQFAPDRSYLPSSVDTSMTPSPIAFDTFEKITAAEAYTPRIQTSGDWILDTQKSQSLHQVVLTPKLPPTAIVEEKKERAVQQQPLCATTTTSHSEGKKKLPSGGKQSEAKVHPAESPMEKAGKSPLVATTSQLGSIVLFDGGRVAESRNFQVLGCQELEDVWVKVLHGCRSNVLRQLLQAHGTLISLCIAKGELQPLGRSFLA